MKENKGKSAEERDVERLEEIKDDIKTIGIRSTWMLGILVIIVLGLTNFISKESIVQMDAGSLIRMIWISATILAATYTVLLLIYIPLLIMPNFGKPIHENYEMNHLQKSIKQNAEILNRLNKYFRTLIYLFIGLPFFSTGIATYFA